MGIDLTKQYMDGEFDGDGISALSADDGHTPAKKLHSSMRTMNQGPRSSEKDVAADTVEDSRDFSVNLKGLNADQRAIFTLLQTVCDGYVDHDTARTFGIVQTTNLPVESPKVVLAVAAINSEHVKRILNTFDGETSAQRAAPLLEKYAARKKR